MNYCGSGAIGNSYGDAADGMDCSEGGCVKVQKTYKTVSVPCTRNVTQKYKVKVPHQIRHKVPKQVPYTDYEYRTETVPVPTTRTETKYRDVTRHYKEPVTKQITVYDTVNRKVPKIVYVKKQERVPRAVQKVVYEDRTRTDQVPYTVKVPDLKYVSRKKRVPVTKTKIQYVDKVEIKYKDQVRTRCEPVTKMIQKKIPVFKVVPKNPPPCPSGGDAAYGGAAAGAAATYGGAAAAYGGGYGEAAAYGGEAAAYGGDSAAYGGDAAAYGGGDAAAAAGYGGYEAADAGAYGGGGATYAATYGGSAEQTYGGAAYGGQAYGGQTYGIQE